MNISTLPDGATPTKLPFIPYEYSQVRNRSKNALTEICGIKADFHYRYFLVFFGGGGGGGVGGVVYRILTQALSQFS